ncbi:MAG TPA: IS110 family transposase [Jiangellaceae bacterium]|nr:IS110 family transposase [Jiangellaceae bacterium]
MYVIGIDPHKGSHTAAVLDRDEELLGELRVIAGRRQRDELLAFAAGFEPRTWAIEAASGWGALLAQQLVAAGEAVLDVPPALSARARLLDGRSNDKTDRHDARSAAIVAVRHRQLRPVVPVDHTAVLRLLADRHHDLTAARTRAICRLHALLCLLIAGGRPRQLKAPAAAAALRSVRPTGPVEVERKAMATDLLGDVRRLDDQINALKQRIAETVVASGTTVTDVYGVGPIGAAIIIGHTGDVSRFPTSGHYARYNATAPIEASSGPRVRHRLNPRGNRQLNHALHMAAVTQVRKDTPGRAYYLRKQAEGKGRKEALRALKRRISDAVYRQLVADTHH